MSASVRLRTVALNVLVLCLLAVLAACGRSSDFEPVDPGTTRSPSTNPGTESGQPVDPSEPTSGSGPPAGWEDRFTDEELRAYRAALFRWERYSDRSNKIYATGKNTPEAQEFFKESDLLWQGRIATLQQTYEEGGLRRTGFARPLWTAAKSVELDKGGKVGTVFITQCTDYSTIAYERGGAPLKGIKPENRVTALTIQMDKPEGRDWLYVESTLKDKKSCAA